MGAAIAAPALLAGGAGYAVAAIGAVFALTGIFSYCPACAVTVIGK